MMAAYFYGSIFGWIAKRSIKVASVFMFVLIFFSMVDLKQNISFTPTWFKWNFEGYEAKSSWGM
jgi:hypothetical protein